jgi:pimeloyl-ACP methyl ester carboxylesterase
MHFLCEGNPNARPVVILEHGIGETLDVWAWVQARLSNSTYVCAFSRRGYGYSTPGTRPRTAQITTEELHLALAALNITSPVVMVGHGWAGFSMRRYYHAYPDDVHALVFVDGLSTQCYDKPKCDANSKKPDTEGYAYWESVIPFGFARAAAYYNYSFPGPAGECVVTLPVIWGQKGNKARERLLAALLSPSNWGAALLEDSDTPSTCALASQGPGNSANNKIVVPVISIIADQGVYKDKKQCGIDLKNAGGGKLKKKNRAATTYSVAIDGSNHFTLLCVEEYADQVTDEIIKVVELVRENAKTFTAITNAGKKTWAQSKTLCESVPGRRLAMIKTADQQFDVSDLGLNSANDDFWIGGSDASSPGTFKWGDGSTLSSTYTNFNQNEPNNDGDCLQVIRNGQNRWRDRPCSELKYPLCESDEPL